MKKSRITIVDDDPQIVGMLHNVLARAGYEVWGTGHPELALRHIQSARPDLVILDVAMPNLDGFEVATHLRSFPATRGIPILFLSGSDREGSDWVGADGFISKPADLFQLVDEVERLVRSR